MTGFYYNPFGQRIRRTLPGGHYEEFFYDAAGNKTIHTNFTVSLEPVVTVGRTTEFKYDALNRLVKKYDRGQEANPWVVFTYLASGQRDTMVDGTGTTDYEYHPSGRLWKKVVPYLPQGDQTLTYSYEERGNLKEVAGPGGYGAEYAWDSLNRLETVLDQNQRATRYTYDLLGNFTAIPQKMKKVLA